MVTVGSRLDWLEVVPNRADAHGAAEDGWAFTLFSSGRSTACRALGPTPPRGIGSWRTCHSGRRTGRQAGTETPRDGSDQRGEGVRGGRSATQGDCSGRFFRRRPLLGRSEENT